MTDESKPRRKPGPKTEIPGEVMITRLVCVDSLSVRKLKVLGGGNVSKGVREAARVAYDRLQKT